MIRLLTSWEIIAHVDVCVTGDFVRFCPILVRTIAVRLKCGPVSEKDECKNFFINEICYCFTV